MAKFKALIRTWAECARGRTVYMLDFAFGPELTAALDERAAKLVVLDHHKSAAEKADRFSVPLRRGAFDMHHSGARLAWEFFHPEKAVPALIRYIEDRVYPGSGEFAESAAFLGGPGDGAAELAALGRDRGVQP